MNNPLVSVIIPAYNHERYVEETINSIIAQTYDNIELIVVDDGSKDSTWQKICAMREKCEARFRRVVFETQQNQGTCRTLNRLMNLAQGDYLYLIASDDQAEPEAIACEIEFLKEHPDYVLAVGDNAFVDGDSKIIGWGASQESCPIDVSPYKTFGEFLRRNRKDVSFETEDFGSYQSLTRGNYIPNGYLIRASALKKIGEFTPEAPLEDWYLHLQLSKLGKYKYFDKVLFRYRWHGTNTAKQRDHMVAMTDQTLLFEQRLVATPGHESWQKLFVERWAKPSMKVALGNLLKIYTIRYPHEGCLIKRHVLEIFGKPFLLKETSRRM